MIRASSIYQPCHCSSCKPSISPYRKMTMYSLLSTKNYPFKLKPRGSSSLAAFLGTMKNRMFATSPLELQATAPLLHSSS
ncbi:mrna binding post-transcriptional regulator, partial [Moniliophthora roreri]